MGRKLLTGIGSEIEIVGTRTNSRPTVLFHERLRDAARFADTAIRRSRFADGSPYRLVT